MSDEVGVETPVEGVPAINWAMPEADIEIVGEAEVEAEAEKGEVDKDALLAEVSRLKEQLAAKQAPVAEAPVQPPIQQQPTLSAEQLAALAQLQAPRQPQETEAEFAARVNEKFYDSPYEMLNEFVQKKLSPEVNKLMANNMANSREFVRLDPKYGPIFEKYGAEIEAEVQRVAPQERYSDPQIYRKATDRVMMQHTDEIISQRVEEELEKRLGKEKPVAQEQERVPVTGFNEASNMVPNPEGGKKKPKVVVTAEEEAYGLTIGLSKQKVAEWKLRNPGKKLVGGQG